jgi:hypothetical protein
MKTTAGDIPRPHTIEECPQGPTIAQLQRSTDRVAVALESIAAQGVAVEQHEKRLDKNDREHDEIFPRLRAVERAVDIKTAHDKGVAEIKGEVNRQAKVNKRFWDAAKIQILVHWGPVLVFFTAWILDKFGVFVWLGKQFAEMQK